MKKFISFLAILTLTISTMFTFTACDGLKKLDLFDLVTVEFEGVNGKGSVSFKNNDTVLNKDWHNLIKLETENDGQLSNGDEIIVEIRNISRKDIGAELKELGYEVRNDKMKKEFTVSGLSETLTVDKVTNGMKNQLKDIVFSSINADNKEINETVILFGNAINDDAEYDSVILVAIDYDEQGYEIIAPELREELVSKIALYAFYDCYPTNDETEISWQNYKNIEYTKWGYTSAIFDDVIEETKDSLSQYDFVTIN